MINTPADSKRPLRIGLFLDSLTQPRWVSKIIDDIQSSDFAEICLVVKNEATGEQPLGRLRTYWKNRKYLLYAFYSRVDNRVSLAEDDAFEDVEIQQLLSGVPVLGVMPEMKKFSDWFPDEAVQKIRTYDLDVVISHGFRILRGEALRLAKHGVWSYHHGDNLVNRGGPAGFWEVMEGSPISGAVLQVLSEDLDNGQIISRGWSRTIDRFSVKSSRNNLYWRSSSFVVRKLKELYANGKVTSDADAFRPYYNRLHTAPTNAELLPRLFKLTWSYAAQKARYSFNFDQWQLAYRFRSSPDDVNNSFYRFKYLVPPKDKFWADPFAVKFEGKYFVFFEEYIYKDDKAHISVIELSKSGASEATPVLKRDYHLSYPFMLHWNDRYYMIPETAGNKTIEVYTTERFPNEWKLETVLFEGIAARDATLFEVDRVWWMFVAIADTEFSDELHLYYSESPLGPWKPHAKNPVKSDVRNSRPAGRPFYWKGNLYRPAQDSSVRYGYGMRINKIIKLTPTEFREEEISQVLPNWRKDLRGTHTLNICDDLTIIDCLVHRRK